jgi:hypothetical protein
MAVEIVHPTVTVNETALGRKFIMVTAPHWRTLYIRTAKRSPNDENVTIEQRAANLQTILDNDITKMEEGGPKFFALKRFIDQGSLKAKLKIAKDDQAF